MITSVPSVCSTSYRLRLLLLVLCTVLALVLGVTCFTPTVTEFYVTQAGYGLILTSTALFLASLIVPLRRWWLTRPRRWPEPLGPALAFGATVFLGLAEPMQFKIVMDEVVLAGTAMSMHYDRQVLMPTAANDYEGDFQIQRGYLDKRPFFYPFLVSLVHDLTGYRSSNSFYLNLGLTFVLLWLVFVAGRQLGGRVAGVTAVLLLAGLPLLAQNATGGHFEVLNLVMMMAVLLLGMRFVREPEEWSMTALCYAGALLLQTRYESAVYVVPVVLMVLGGWWRARRVVLAWPVVFLPLLLMHSPMHFLVITDRPDFAETGTTGASQAFSTTFVPDNVEHAFRYLFHYGPSLTNSVLLSCVGLVGFLLFLRRAGRDGAGWFQRGEPGAPLALLGLGVLLSFVITMHYHWSEFDDVVASRFSLPLQVFLVLCTAQVMVAEDRWLRRGAFALFGFSLAVTLHSFGLEQWIKQGFSLVVLAMLLVVLVVVRRKAHWPGPVFLGAVSALLALVVGRPVMANHQYLDQFVPLREVEMWREFMREQPRRDYMFLTRSSVVAILERIPAFSIQIVLQDPSVLRTHLKHRTFNHIYVAQLFTFKHALGSYQVYPNHDLGPNYVLETVREQRISKFVRMRFSRLVEVTDLPPASSDAGESPTATATDLPAEPIPPDGHVDLTESTTSPQDPTAATRADPEPPAEPHPSEPAAVP